MKKIIYIAFFVVLMLSMLGCHSAGGQFSAEAMTQISGDMTATLSFDPDPPAMMSPVEMTLMLTDSAGEAVDGAQVSYDLTMPAMTMPPNQPEASGQGNGEYQTEATFTMGGEWQADVTVVVNSETVNFTFDFEVQ